MMTRRFGCCCAWACKEAGLSIAAIDTIAVAPINCAQLSLFPAVWLSLSIVSTWHLRLLVAIDPLVVVMNVAAPSVCGWIEKKLLAGASWGTVYQTHKTEINISAGVASKRPWFYLPFVGLRGSRLKFRSHLRLLLALCRRECRRSACRFEG